MAGLSNYEMVDINTEVFRNFNKQFKRIIEPLEEADSQPSLAGTSYLIAALRSSQSSPPIRGGLVRAG